MRKFFFGMFLAIGLLTFAGGCLGSAAARELPVPPESAQVEQALRGVPGAIFPVGNYNAANKDHFTGPSYAAALADGKQDIPVVNVTFYKGAYTYWHRHFGTCQVLVGASGHGYYQIWGQQPQKLEPGQTVTIPEGVKHWHGAAPGQMFQHISIMKPGTHTTEWLEPVDSTQYEALKK